VQAQPDIGIAIRRDCVAAIFRIGQVEFSPVICLRGHLCGRGSRLEDQEGALVFDDSALKGMSLLG
jgi:hypothetical protein